MNNLFKSAVMSILMASLCSCYVDNNLIDYFEIQRKAVEQRKIWKNAAIDNYQYVATEYCFCRGREALIVVQNNMVVQADLLPPYSDSYIDGLDLTMEQRFDLIDEGIRKGYNKIVVEYNKDYGFPQSIFFDPYVNAVDEEVTHVVDKFEIIPNP